MSDLEFLIQLEEYFEIKFIKNPKNEIERKPFFVTDELDNITVLGLSGIDLSEKQIDFSTLQSLHQLRLSFCELKEIPVSVFDLPRLKRLQLAGNDLKSISEDIKKLINLESLSIRRCSLKQLPLSVFLLEKLQILNASANYLTTIPREILNLTNIERLDLGHNKFEIFPEIVCKLASLRVFEYYGNDLSEIPSEINELNNLVHLHLTGCGIHSVPAHFEILYSLAILELGSNNLQSFPESICDLMNLRKLTLASNRIKDIPDSINKLIRLETLDISDNELEVLPNSLTELSNLKVLEIHRNNLSSLPRKISNLKKLHTINFSSNFITEIPVALCQVDNVFLQNNEITSIPHEVIVYAKQVSYNNKSPLASFNFNGNPVRTPPIEVLAAGREACIAWYNSQQEQTIALKELKIIVIGDGGAGKTSLINRICDNAYHPEQSVTHGVNIRKTSLGSSHFNFTMDFNYRDIVLNIWDFGGQEIMHATHQFFLSNRALYILVVDSRKDQKTEYWLNHIATFGGDSPVLVVMNKIDDNPSHDLNRKSLQDKYNIKGFFPVSCKDGKGLQNFYNSLIQEVSNSSLLKEKWNTKWLGVKNELEAMQSNYVSYDRFVEICLQKGLSDKDQQKTLLGYLHSLGIVLHFPDFELKDTNVLNPKWVTEAVYKIINSKLLAKTKGILDKNDLDFILNEEESQEIDSGFKLNVRYNATEQNHIVNLMFKFELCFSYNDKFILLPDLLMVDEPDFSFDYKNALKYILEYDFLPKSVMARFIVKMAQHSKKDLLWRTGILLCYDENEAAVKSDEVSKRVYVWVNGADKRGYFSIIRSIFLDINKNLQHPPEELIPCICSECRESKEPYFFKYSVLLKAKFRQKLEWPCERSAQNVKILKMIDDIIIENEQSKQNKRSKLFISYAHTDVIWLKRLKVHLRAIANEGLELNVWDDTMIKPGMVWKNEIQKALDETKIAILLISTDFLASDFIINNELPTLLKTAEMNGAIILSLIVKPSRYAKNQTLSQFQAANDPLHPMINLSEGEQDLILVNLTNRIEEIMETIK
ncbi:MAG: hypothetical protein JWQ09_4212 [Segetibacter sp.]|nr:hypothetical protein [Segetibacter sp.]